MANQNILVIEDETRSRNLFVSCLQAEGYNTLVADNGITGIQLAQQKLPDLVVCDIVMPKLDGYGVLSRLRQNKATALIPFIFLTAKDSKVELRQGMKLGADDYLTKPLTAEELIEAVIARLARFSPLRNRNATMMRLTLPGREGRSSSDADTKSSLASDEAAETIFPFVPQLNKVFQYIEAHYDRGITLSDVAKAVGYSPAYLTNIVGKQTGKTVNRWIIERRMVAACCLLRETNKSVESIAKEIGYQDACHFSRQFRQYWQTTPQTWRKSNT